MKSKPVLIRPVSDERVHINSAGIRVTDLRTSQNLSALKRRDELHKGMVSLGTLWPETK